MQRLVSTKVYIEEQFQVEEQEAKRKIHCAILWSIRVSTEFLLSIYYSEHRFLGCV